MKIHFILNIFLVGLLFKSADRLENNDEKFTIIKKDGMMELSERWISMEGNVDSREIRMVMKISATKEEILKVLKDEKKGRYWNVNAERFHVKNLDSQKWVSFLEYHLPFPLANRACYFLNEWEHLGNLIVIKFKTEELDIFTKDQNLETIQGLEGKWVIENKGAYTELRYHIISVPDESMPRWIIDPIVRKNLWASMERLKFTIESQ